MHLSALLSKELQRKFLQVFQVDRASQFPLITVKAVARSIPEEARRRDLIRLLRSLHGLPDLFLRLLVERPLHQCFLINLVRRDLIGFKLSVQARNQLFRVLSGYLTQSLRGVPQPLIEIGPYCIFNRSNIFQVVNVHDLLLPIAIHAPHALLVTHRVPRQIVIHQNVAELQVDAFPARLR